MSKTTENILYLIAVAAFFSGLYLIGDNTNWLVSLGIFLVIFGNNIDQRLTNTGTLDAIKKRQSLNERMEKYIRSKIDQI